MLNSLPFLPTLCCLKNSGPGDSASRGIAVISIIGADNIQPTMPKNISNTLFTAIHLGSGAAAHPHAARRPGTALQRGGPAQSVVRLPVETLQDLTEAVPNRFRDIRRRGRPRVGQPHFLFAGESASAGFGQLLPANLSLPTSACYSPPTSFSPSNYCQLSPLDHIRWTPVWPDGRRVTPPAPRQGIP